MTDLSDAELELVSAMRLIRSVALTHMPPQEMLNTLGSIDDFAKAMSAFIQPAPIAGLWVLARVIGSVLGREAGVGDAPIELIAATTMFCAGILMEEALSACDRALANETPTMN